MTILRYVLSKLLVRRTCWSLTLAGKLLVLCLVIAATLGTIRGLFPFLAVKCPERGDIMVVEGWIRERSITQVVQEYQTSQYREVVVVNAVYGSGDKWESGRYRGEYLTNALVRHGVPSERVSLVTCDVTRKDRTYHSAVAVRKWLQQQDISAKSLNVATVGPHARRSRLLFEKAFGRGVSIGVIALDEHGYDPVHWWRSSEGVREVLFEGVAYLYVRFFFSPD